MHCNGCLSHTHILLLEPNIFKWVLIFAQHVFSIAMTLIQHFIVYFFSSKSTLNTISVIMSCKALLLKKQENYFIVEQAFFTPFIFHEITGFDSSVSSLSTAYASGPKIDPCIWLILSWRIFPSSKRESCQLLVTEWALNTHKLTPGCLPKTVWLSD